ncbi:sensor histidine kinase [Bordetella petrii]|uniref:sensor histidine kinase n=1 Tax=Bordetella petrii TaxID=94624 RepID=UPI000490F0BD|nr:ATP-binding protein [Bordetella petrii]
MFRSHLPAALAWLLLLIPGVVAIGLQDYAAQRDRFVQDTSIVHRMLSQKAVQHEAVLATLAALSHPPAPERLFPSLQPALPQLQAVGHSDGAHWRGSAAPPAGLAGAIARARALGRPTALAAGAEGYWLVGPSGWSMRVDGRQLLAPADIPGTLGALSLDLPGGRLDLLASGAAGPGLQLQRDKPLGAASQPFALHSARRLTPGAWPWAAWLAWAAASAAMVAGWTLWRRSRAYARREREQARLAAIGRLNTLGEMAAGIAHELNQPLTAILAHAGAAQRMLDDPHEQTEVRRALQSTAAQARRAAEILGRLRTLVAHGAPVRRAPLDPDELVASLRFLREEELARQGIRLGWHNADSTARPLGDRVALEQILHNLVQNAADALAGQPAPRRLDLRGRVRGAHYEFTVRDNGPGIPADVLPRIFEPFYTTRGQGMGLGLALCETLAGAMDALLDIRNHEAGGVCATLALPLLRPPDGHAA